MEKIAFFSYDTLGNKSLKARLTLKIGFYNNNKQGMIAWILIRIA